MREKLRGRERERERGKMEEVMKIGRGKREGREEKRWRVLRMKGRKGVMEGR